MSAIHRNGFAPFRFLTPFPHRPSRRLRHSARQPSHFLHDVCVKNSLHQIDPNVLKHTQRPISSASLDWPAREGQIFKVASSIPVYFTHTIWKRTDKSNPCNGAARASRSILSLALYALRFELHVLLYISCVWRYDNLHLHPSWLRRSGNRSPQWKKIPFNCQKNIQA